MAKMNAYIENIKGNVATLGLSYVERKNEI
jgi:hypothetical protein